MSDRKTKPESCEECGAVFMTHPFHKRGKKGWLCSATCVAARRLRVHGRNCLHCTSRYVEESVVRRNAGFCSLHCKTENGKSLRMKACIHCKEEFESVNNTKFCSHKCSADHQRAAASKNCLCCGKTWYRHSISRKKSKYDSSKYHNCFCSKQCAKKYSEFECARKARCRCGKPTGQSRVEICQDCRIISADRSELGEYANCIRSCFDTRPTGWDRRCHAATQSLKIRQHTKTGKEKQRKAGDTWDEAIQKQWKAMRQRIKQRGKQGWSKRIQNAVNLLGKRQRRKQLPQS